MDQTPDEIIGIIVQYLIKLKDLCQLAQTCKRMQPIVNNSNIWLYLCHQHIFADTIIKMQIENKLSWRENFKLIDDTIIRSQEYLIINDNKKHFIQLKGSGKCYKNAVYNIKKPNYIVEVGENSYSMYITNNSVLPTVEQWDVGNFVITNVGFYLLYSSKPHKYFY